MIYLIFIVIVCTMFICSGIRDLVEILQKIYDHLRWGGR